MLFFEHVKVTCSAFTNNNVTPILVICHWFLLTKKSKIWRKRWTQILFFPMLCPYTPDRGHTLFFWGETKFTYLMSYVLAEPYCSIVEAMPFLLNTLLALLMKCRPQTIFGASIRPVDGNREKTPIGSAADFQSVEAVNSTKKSLLATRTAETKES